MLSMWQNHSKEDPISQFSYLERDTRSHVAEAQAFVSGSGGVDSSTDAALLMVVGLSGALEQREPVRLRTGVGTQEHAGQLQEHISSQPTEFSLT